MPNSSSAPIAGKIVVQEHAAINTKTMTPSSTQKLKHNPPKTSNVQHSKRMNQHSSSCVTESQLRQLQHDSAIINEIIKLSQTPNLNIERNTFQCVKRRGWDIPHQCLSTKRLAIQLHASTNKNIVKCATLTMIAETNGSSCSL